MNINEEVMNIYKFGTYFVIEFFDILAHRDQSVCVVYTGVV